jgi:hypothetical protein
MWKNLILKELNDLELRMLMSLRRQLLDVLQYTFQHYKALNETEPSGMFHTTVRTIGSRSLPAPALPVALELIRLLHEGDLDRMRESLREQFKQAAQLIFHALLEETEELDVHQLKLGGDFEVGAVNVSGGSVVSISTPPKEGRTRGR